MNAIEVRDLTVRYDDQKVLNECSLTVGRGEIFGLLGRNGAGKTTLIETIAGLRAAGSGKVRVLGLDPVADRHEFTTRLAIQPQAAALLPSQTTIETLQLFAALRPRSIPAAEALVRLQLEDAAHTRVAHLSGGQTRRLLLAIALIGRPEVVLLDEPSAGLDPEGREELWEIVRDARSASTTIVLSTHHLDEAEAVCDRVGTLHDGNVELGLLPSKADEADSA